MMATVVPSHKELAQLSRRELYYNVFSTLMRLQIEASPVHYELMCEIISGNNPELREKFARLGKNISDADMEELARSYVPHHFEKSALDRSATLIRGELTTLKQSLETGHTSLSNYTSLLGQATGRISSADPSDTEALQSELQAIRQATEVQRTQSSQLLTSVTTQISKVGTIRDELDEFERTKFLHVATQLANRRGFNKRLTEIYMQEHFPEEVSLLFCNLVALQPFEKKELIKAKEAILQRLGAIVSQSVRRADYAAWLDRPQIGIVVATTSEADIQRLTEQLKLGCLGAFGARQGAPIVTARFGCANTLDAKALTDLVSNAEKALETAIAADDDKVVFFGGGKTAAVRKDWSLYKG
ncbi:diguanylate cyclase domain-containing protein [Rhizobium sp. RAF56]|uniref:diguanylate cyclase domain-containing protein n=1 Tax=Rhizobium sp. RAF56 TaxID=3233062 RepID=UPI003F9E8D79